MSTSEDLSGVMRRVQKLLAIAGDARANPEEAAAAAAMAEKVMRKFQLEHADVVRAELNSKDNFATEDACAVMKKGKGHRPTSVPSWAQWLACQVAKLNDCEVKLAWNRELGSCIRFFGYKSDVQVCAWMFDYLTTTLIRNVRAYQKADQWGFKRSKAESESYRRGFVAMLQTLLQRSIDAKEREAQAASSNRALMVVKKQALAEHFGDFSYKTGKAKDVSNKEAFKAGLLDASKVDVNLRALNNASQQGGALLLN